jgi:outer membrane protein assembly factor BamA
MDTMRHGRSWLFGMVWILCMLGYHHASATPTDSTHSPAYAIIDEIRLAGNRLTKAAIILREMDVQPGDTIQLAALPNRLKANAQRIFNTRLFVRADVAADSIAPDRRRLLVTVKENWYLWPSPYVRLNDRNLNEWLDRGRDLSRLNYGMYIGHTNLFGRMQRLEAMADIGFATRLMLRYNVPYLDRKRNWGIHAEVNYQALANLAYNTLGNQLEFVYRDETLLRQTDTRLRLRRRQGLYTFHYAELTYTQTNITEALTDLNPFYLGEGQITQQLTSLAYTYRYDGRDNINFPLKGRAFIAEVRRFGLLSTDDFRAWQGRVIFADYYPLSRRPTNKWFTSYMLRSRVFANANTPYNLLRGIGYEEDILRGYDLYVVNGSAFGMLRTNLKRELWQKTFHVPFLKWRQFNEIPLSVYLNAYTDWGYVYNRYPARLDNPLANSLLSSTGLGLEISTWYNAVIRLNASRNRLGQTLFFLNLQKDIGTRNN